MTLQIHVSQQPDGIVYYRAFTHAGSDGAAVPVTLGSDGDYTPVLPGLEEIPVSDFLQQDDGSYIYERTYELSTVADAVAEEEEIFYFDVAQLSVSGHGDYSTTIEGREDGAQITIQDRGRPEIEGRPQVGHTLTVITSTINDVDGTTDAELGTGGRGWTYQWYRVDADGSSGRTEITGAAGRAYTLTGYEQGKKVIVEVSFVDDAGNDEGPLASEAYPGAGTIGVGNATGVPVISGTPRVGETLTADTMDIMDPNGNDKAEDGDSGYAYSYQWFRVDKDGVSNAVRVGSDQDSYTLTGDDAGRKIRVQVTFVDDFGFAEGPLESDPYPQVGFIVAGNAKGKPVIEGRPWVDEKLTVNTSDISDLEGKTKAESDDPMYKDYAYSYQWFRVDKDGVGNDPPVGTQDSYTLTLGDKGWKITVRVTFMDDAGNDEGPLESDPYPGLGTIQANNAAGQPTISGQPHVGELLTADTSGIMDPDETTKRDNNEPGYAYSYQWWHVDPDGSNPAEVGSNQKTYELVADDVGKKIVVTVKYKDDGDTDEGPLESEAFPKVGTVREADTDAPAFESAGGPARSTRP